MKPLYVLIGTFGISLLLLLVIIGNWNFGLAGRIAMAVMLLFTSIGHFAFTKGMTMMMPDFIPFKKFMVYLTGILEMLGAIGLLIPSMQLLSAYLLILFFLLMLPVNIHAAYRKVNYEKGTFEGKGLNYLWIRVPLQLFFIAWTYFFSILH